MEMKNVARMSEATCGAEFGFAPDFASLIQATAIESPMPKPVPFLMFNDQSEAAMNFYLSVFDNARIVRQGREADGRVNSGTFEIEGQLFHCYDGGPMFSFAQGFSLFVSCETQAEVDALWDKLSAGGEIQRCGWLKDKFGVSWQIIPTILGKGLQDKDPARAQRVMQAMLGMKKLDLAGLRAAADGKA